MWRSILVYAIKAAVASGLADKAKDKVVGWLKGKLAKHVTKLEKKVNADLDAVEEVAGPVLVEDEPKED